MFERNIAIWKLLVLLALVLAVAGIVVTAAVGKDVGGSLAMALCDALVAGGMYVAVKHPEWNRQYTLKRVEGRLRLVRVTYETDLQGWRYVMCGALLLGIVVLMDFFYVAELFCPAMPEWVSVAVLVAVAAAMVGVCVALERKINNGTN